jgi:hypothetical protein
MIKKVFNATIAIIFVLLFFYAFMEAFKAWDTAPAPSLPECVDGTVRSSYGNCVLPEELRTDE